MNRRIYPRTFLLLAMFPLIAFTFTSIIYLAGATFLDYLNLLPLHIELLMSYHVLTICLPLGFVIATIYWSRSKIIVKNGEIIFRSKLLTIRKSRVKIGDIIEICAHETGKNDATKKFHIHLEDENLEIIEFWYDEAAMLDLAKTIKSNNPNIKMNENLKSLI